MYLHIGGDVVLPCRSIIAVFDALSTDQQVTREFLRTYREEGFAVSTAEGGPVKSLVLTQEKLYLSSIASATLRRRWISFLADERE
ncbi:MAG: hypothetical protein DDT37_00097 [Firmicutes bacterium]|nr:hypothetical protein [candidate division NPL-UPA2 bacterium]MBT9153958.1 hypothetical protein [candidate division NPL-UPA2 bacterium]MBT9155132.1 hypothetical protein [candidate division NPL-UPA2 bacterium]